MLAVKHEPVTFMFYCQHLYRKNFRCLKKVRWLEHTDWWVQSINRRKRGYEHGTVGVIESITESLASLLKVFSGYLSDRYQKKKRLAFVGYSTGLFYKFSLLFAGSWIGILIARVIDRFGKGIRTAPRDVMVAESSGGNKLGKSFGIHKALLDIKGKYGKMQFFVEPVFWKEKLDGSGMNR